MNSSRNEFKLRIGIDAPISRVYQAWASPSGLESWFLRRALITRPGGEKLEVRSLAAKGDSYEWHWHGYLDDVAVKGKFLDANGVDHLSFSFADDCPVHISLLTECDETVVQLVESTAAIDEETIRRRLSEDSKGWVFYLANLKSILEGGLDLRNKKLELINVINS
ncbi:MAG TPA: SRPBCC domain-containing protein [Puia sp.]|nr:SRPBCC domain-containing protein [Puia sp.]